MLTLNISVETGQSLIKINKDLSDYLKDSFELTKNILGDILLQHYFFNYDDYYMKFHRNILIQPIDGTIIKQDFVDIANKYNYIITPSNNNKTQLISSGVEKPITIIPNYYDDELLEKDNGFFNSLFDEKKYTFYTESTGIKRKNIDNILKYFLETFTEKEKVRLIIKLNEVDPNIVNSLKDIIKNAPNKPEVIIINKRLPSNYLYSFIRNIDCYVCLSYMEGFCIPLLNAAVLKKDIITLNSKISGYMDFINKKNSVLLPVKKIKIDNSPENLRIYSEDSEWEEPNYNEYKKSLLSVYKGEYKFDKNLDYSKFSKEVVMKQYEDFLKNLEPEIEIRKQKILDLAKKRYENHFSKFRIDTDLNIDID